ncbi:unnamed protein product, partial [Closterium sp. NIES-53]
LSRVHLSPHSHSLTPPPPTSFFLAAIIYPVIAHIIWSHHGLLSADAGDYVLGTRGVLDNAGSMVVHVTGGWVAMAQVGEWAWHRWVGGHGMAQVGEWAWHGTGGWKAQ